eukprot:CAMPEP_0170186240 /NCGR_PEP_ID=MMETSP0040_2-20121228/38587_1 /TAXON_ID=641309 /ORGANISM="Lotharella oceanica, Strain CCMP622" /LENGTH=132 /DNA_ID=CAMNT_0010432907 /DNA_START=262 /DNA_END=660 /DNA_ORIENTATION=-
MEALLGKHLGYLPSKLQALLVIESRITRGLPVRLEILLAKALRPSDTFGDVLPGELQMNPSQVLPVSLEHLMRLADLGKDVFVATGLVAQGRLEGVAVHRVHEPHHVKALRANGLCELRESSGDILRAKSCD